MKTKIILGLLALSVSLNAQVLAGVVTSHGAGTPSGAAIVSSNCSPIFSSTSGSTAPIDTTDATLLVVALTYYQGAGGVVVTDSQGGNSNTWTNLTQYGSTPIIAGMSYSYPTHVGGSHVFTVTTTANYFGSICVQAWKNTPGASFQGGTDSGATCSGCTTVAPGAITPGLTNNVLITVVGQDFALAPTFTAPAGYTISDSSSGGSIASISMAWKVQAGNASTNPTWTMSTSGSNTTAIAAFTGN